MATQPTRNTNDVLWHATDKAAEALHVAAFPPGRGENRSGAKEQQTLEQRMVEHMQEGGGEREPSAAQPQAVRLEGRARGPSPMKMMPIFSMVL